MHTHHETHSTSSQLVRDIVIGMADGLTVPFALAAGLSGALSSTRIVVTAGLAEIAAGSIAMGLGGYLAARGDAEHYESELQRERHEIVTVPEVEKREIVDIFVEYGVQPHESATLVEALAARPEAWVDFMMRFELGLEEPDPKRAVRSALTIAASYVVGGFIPLTPYIVLGNAAVALRVSVIVTLIALFSFGFVKGQFTGTRPLRSALQTMLTGGLAAAAAFVIARAIS